MKMRKTRLVKLEVIRPNGRIERLEFWTSKKESDAIEAVARNIESRGLGQVRVRA